jgi:hypothetical protein
LLTYIILNEMQRAMERETRSRGERGRREGGEREERGREREKQGIRKLIE